MSKWHNCIWFAKTVIGLYLRQQVFSIGGSVQSCLKCATVHRLSKWRFRNIPRHFWKINVGKRIMTPIQLCRNIIIENVVFYVVWNVYLPTNWTISRFAFWFRYDSALLSPSRRFIFLRFSLSLEVSPTNIIDIGSQKLDALTSNFLVSSISIKTIEMIYKNKFFFLIRTLNRRRKLVKHYDVHGFG